MKTNAKTFLLLILSSSALSSTGINAASIEHSATVMVGDNKVPKVSGKVVDKQGEPVIGATVDVNGTDKKAVTDINGHFSFQNIDGSATLTVTYIGFQKATLKVSENMEFVLEENNHQLNEVVVVGYGTMRRKDVTSSITTINAKDLNRGVYTDPASLLQGKVAGLTITQNGDPSGTPSITLRGASSLRSGAAMEPYYVIDGIPGMDISLVAPEDIESIDVLRDATATAIYGSKAANGVIIVTTKKGKAGRTNVSYSGYVAFDNVLKNLDMMSASQLRKYAKDNDIDISKYDKGADTDWQKETERTAISHNHNVSISGGNGNTSYNASINYLNREGTIKATSFNRLNGRALVQTAILKDRLHLSAGLNASESHFNTIASGDNGASVSEALNYYSPLNPVRNEDGSWYADKSISQYYNPLSMLNEDRAKTIQRHLLLTTKGELKILDGLTWTANYSYENSQNVYSSYNSINSQTDSRHGAAHRDITQGHRQVFETFGNYNKTFNDKHILGLMAGYSWEENHAGDQFGATAYYFYNDAVGYNNLSYASKIDGVNGLTSGAESVLRMISFYGRANYSYASKYNLQATIRRDGSSAFGANNRWATFPSVSAAWRISEEGFIKKLNIFDDLKLRAGYGVSGNSLGFDAYSAIQTYGATGWFTYTDGTNYRTLTATKNANPNLKWERTGMFNIGLDFALLGSRINGTIEYYIKKTSDLIYDYPVSTNRYQFGYMTANVGDITNKGIELTINAIPIRTKDFTWNTTLNLSHNENTVDKLSNAKYSVKYIDLADPNLANFSGNTVQRLMEGQPIGTFYLWEWAGYNEQGHSIFYVHDEKTGLRTGETTESPADKDRTIVGNAQPKLTLGWNNMLTYKNWSLNMFFQGVFGNKIFNAMRAQYNWVGLISQGKNALAEIATNQKYTDQSYSNAPSDRYLENGSYLRLSTLTLGYTFGDVFNGWIKNLQVYGTVDNVFTITGYKGIDPEVDLGGLTPGIDWRSSRFPHNRSFIIGLKVNF